ncbi:Transcription elongation factor GreA [Mesoplasma sp. JKS002660]|uniref:transcription elongation factor GreA n=1 Tax=Mesoplasma whartonense TaxID=2878854 RepID=UPI002022B557|nr:transcription elongation factor GreA [Mesoplasma sp. JKS002660]MCL8213307.1 Transcription elongation factor GreA [Mesoplasma sp. JKS002660]
MAEEIILTKEGLEEKRKELRHLIDVIRPQVIDELVEARNQGDLSENADYDAARNKQAEIESRIKELESVISKAKVINTGGKKGEVKIGSQVEYQDLKTQKIHMVKIVGAIEADPFAGLISNESPLAKAMLGHKSEEVLEVREVNVPYKVKVVSVK